MHELTTREDIAIVLITQNVAVQLQSVLEGYNSPLPAILEIPSKDQPYDSKKVWTTLAVLLLDFLHHISFITNTSIQDVILKRVQRIFAEDAR